MAVGISITKAQIDEMAGSSARALRMAFERARTLKQYLDTKTEADLVTAYGYTSAEVALLKSAVNDMVTQATAFDAASAFIKQIWGLGVTNTGS